MLLTRLELENRELRRSLAVLERENARLTRESAHYLGKWIAAQELAAWRTVEVLCKQGPLTPLESQDDRQL